ncbi:MAG TPA: hypothetical protein PLY93_09000 [Turneriella sp.]|nr:hypothetical protein [Turneriella sp.]
MRRALYGFILLFILVNCKKATLHFNDKNTAVANALFLETDRNVSGIFTAKASSFFVRIKITEPVMLRAEVSAIANGDVSLALFHPADTLLFEVNDNGVGNAEEISPVYLHTGEAIIRISNQGKHDAPFTFFYRTFNPPSNIEREPNNNFTTATKIEENRATGFYGPLYFKRGDIREKEQDCFVAQNTEPQNKNLSVQLSKVVGVRGSLNIFDEHLNSIYTTTQEEKETFLKTPPVRILGERVYVCVAAEETKPTRSRDYYDLTFTWAPSSNDTEQEPNDNPTAANTVIGEKIEATIHSLSDVDYFVYENHREYAVSIRVELKSIPENTLSFLRIINNKEVTVFEGNAPRSEIAENLSIDANEKIILYVKNNKRTTKKNFKPSTYTLHFQETALTDENEVEPNNTPTTADTLVDLTQKTGFINPVGDVDFYRLKFDAPHDRILTFESKIDCLLQLTHLRQNKTIKKQTGKERLLYNANFHNDDLIKLHCTNQKSFPKERAYRVQLIEP